jgi:predicted double-glycine peptidase
MRLTVRELRLLIREADEQVQIADVPLVRQKTTYSCGAAAVLAVLKHMREDEYEDVTEDDMIEELGTTSKDGTDPDDIVAYLDENSFDVSTTLGLSYSDAMSTLNKALLRGCLAILDIQAWRNSWDDRNWPEIWDDGHYVVLVGTDDTRLYFMDPSTARKYTYISKSKLPTRWHDYKTDDKSALHNLAIIISNGEQSEMTEIDRDEAKELK